MDKSNEKNAEFFFNQIMNIICKVTLTYKFQGKKNMRSLVCVCAFTAINVKMIKL